MTTENLLDLNVDVLFQQQNVANIHKEHKKIITVIEEKREELRSLVGGRYRDLLQAADTIKKMQESSTCLIAQLKDITQNCHSLNERQLIGFKSAASESSSHEEAKKQNMNYFSNMVQIKLLTMLPDLMWSHIDDANYSKASALYILSRHISTGLRLDTHNALQQQLPVGQKQWSMLKSYYTTIKHYAHCALKTELLEHSNVVDCLLSLLLLENTDLNTLLKSFLALRAATYMQCIREFISDKKKRVKERILLSFQVLTDSMQVVQQCFLSEVTLWHKMSELTPSHSSALITLIDNEDISKHAKYLPEVITNFRLKCKEQPLDMEQAHVDVLKWLNDVDEMNMDLEKLIKQVTTMQLIQEIKIAASTHQKQYNFAPIVHTLNLKQQQLDFFAWKYSPLLHKRFCEIINEKWHVAIDDCLSTIKAHLTEIKSKPVTNCLWQDNLSDMPESLAAALSKTKHEKKLLNCTKGYNSILISICTNFDEHGKYFTQEIEKLMHEEDTPLNEKNDIVAFLSESTQQHVYRMLTDLHNLEISSMAEMLFLALYWTCLIEVCVNFKSCLNAPNKWRQNTLVAKNKSQDTWKDCCQKLQDESFYYWTLLLENVFKMLDGQKYFSATYNHHNLLQDCVVSL